MMSLKIGSLEIPLLAALEIEQSYDPLGGESIFRTISGNGLGQSTWKRCKITTSGSGWLPAGLSALDTTQKMTLSCVVPEDVVADPVTRQAVLPATRRSDAGCQPWGLAIMPSGEAVHTSVVVVDNVATLGAVANAEAYVAMYFPEYLVLASRPTRSGTRSDASYTWQIICEEV